MRRFATLLCCLLALACGERQAVIDNQLHGGDPQNGRTLVARFECGRCHLPTEQPTARDCTGCHAAIGDGHAARVPGDPTFEQVSAWEGRIVHYREVPSLHAVGTLFQRQWLIDYLLSPYDLRPRLGETMPQLPMSEQDARDIVAFLVAAEDKEPYFADEKIADYRVDHTPLRAGDMASGLALFRDQGCSVCHHLSGALSSPPVTDTHVEARSLWLAPDLRYTRERFQPLEVVPWILEPNHHKFDAVMPTLALSYQQARDLAAYIMLTPLSSLPPRLEPEVLPLLDRPVRWDEVNAEVFGKICVHCHDDPDLGVLGDGGPGNVGGFGFGPRGLSFADYESVFAGYVDDGGKRHSVFEPDADGTPHLLAVLLNGKMPLSLPRLSPEQIQLVASWIAGGRRR
jgi:cytochrome c5/mono/diheme cytochrome c family protein